MNDFHFLPFGQRENDLPVWQAAAHGQWLRMGADNNFPHQAQVWQARSSTHASIIGLKTALIAGEGWLISAMDAPPPVGQKHWSLFPFDSRDLQQWAEDLALYQWGAIEVIWSEDRSHLSWAGALPVCELRKSLGEEALVYWSADWAAWEASRQESFKPQGLPAFSLDKTVPARQVTIIRPWAQPLAYPTPDWWPAVGDIEFEAEYRQYKLASMRNGMFPGLHIEVEGLPTEEERQAFYQSVNEKFSGGRNAGRILITYGYESAGRTKVTPIASQAGSDLFQTWAEDARQRIMTAHRLSSPVLAGLPRSGGLGSSAQEIATAFEHFYNAVIRGWQLDILEAVRQVLNHWYQGEQYQPVDIANLKPIRYGFSEQVLLQVLTPDEIRQELGYAPLAPISAQPTQDSPNSTTQTTML